jgi:hypothetical protein
MTTTNHQAAASSSSPLPKLYTSTPAWRCSEQSHKRLHRDGEVCTGSPPTSPIIDTPSKRARLERKKNAALLGLGSSQAAQPTPSRPAPAKTVPAPSNLRAQTSANADAADGDVVPAAAAPPQDDDDDAVDDRQEFDYDDTRNFRADNVEEEEEEDYFNLAVSSHQHTPSQHGSASERIPDTPFDLPSSPPLPFLTASNLSALQDQAPPPPPSQLPLAADASPPPPSVRSLSSAVAAQISRLILRTDINVAHHRASTTQLAAAQGELTVARGQVRQEVVRGDGWRNAVVALLVLCLAYVIWCWWNSAEFEFLENARREWWGL